MVLAGGTYKFTQSVSLWRSTHRNTVGPNCSSLCNKVIYFYITKQLTNHKLKLYSLEAIFMCFQSDNNICLTHLSYPILLYSYNDVATN